jgi:hypothetical protein
MIRVDGSAVTLGHGGLWRAWPSATDGYCVCCSGLPAGGHVGLPAW